MECKRERRQSSIRKILSSGNIEFEVPVENLVGCVQQAVRNTSLYGIQRQRLEMLIFRVGVCSLQGLEYNTTECWLSSGLE